MERGAKCRTRARSSTEQNYAISEPLTPALWSTMKQRLIIQCLSNRIAVAIETQWWQQRQWREAYEPETFSISTDASPFYENTREGAGGRCVQISASLFADDTR